MPPSNATLTLFGSPADAEAAIRQLARDGYDLSKVSMVGRDDDGRTPATDTASNNTQVSSPRPAASSVPSVPSVPAVSSWGGIRGMLVGSGFIVVPSIGPLVVAGPLLTWVVRSLGTSPGPDKQDAMAAGLNHLGIPEHSVLRCEAALRIGKVVVIAEGSAMMMILAREVFRRTPVEVIEQHLHPPD